MSYSKWFSFYHRELDTPSTNRAQTTFFLSLKPKKIKMTNFFIQDKYVLCVSDDNRAEYRLINLSTKRTLFAAKLITRVHFGKGQNLINHFFQGKRNCQIVVWESDCLDYRYSVRGFIDYFFDSILQQFNLAIVDEIMVPVGYLFWYRHLKRYAEQQYPIHLCYDGEHFLSTPLVGKGEMFVKRWEAYCREKHNKAGDDYFILLTGRPMPKLASKRVDYEIGYKDY